MITFWYTDFTVEDIVLQVVTTGDPTPDSSSTALLLGGAVAVLGFLNRETVWAWNDCESVVADA